MFEMHLSQTGRRDAATAVDPLSNAAPILEWTSNEFVNDVASSITIAGTSVTTGIGNTHSPDTLVFQSTGANQLHREDDYYRNAVIQTATGERARIVSYKFIDNDRGIFILEPPIEDFGTGQITISDPTDLASRRVFVPTGEENRINAYVGYVLYNETLDEYATIESYDNNLSIVELDENDAITGWLPSHRYSIRREPPMYDTSAGAGSTTNQVNIGVPPRPDVVGSFIRVQQPAATTVPPQTESRRIVAFDPLTNIATVFPPFTAQTVGQDIEILPFSRDNFSPFIYTGSAQFEDAIYDIRLVSLTLPAHVPLTTRTGGTVASSTSSYYVQLHDVSNHNYYSPIYSNNPCAVNALFRASYYNFDANSSNEFVHFVGDDAKQIMKFRLETNLRFRIYTRDGETLAFDLPERQSPAEPERRIQITALFEFIKQH